MSLSGKRIKPFICKVDVEDLLPDDLSWLDKALRTDYHGISKEVCLANTKAGLMQLWRMGAWQGIIVTEIIGWDSGKSLVGLYIAGKGYLKNLDGIKDTLRFFAETQGCRVIEFATQDKRLQRVYERKFVESTRIYSLEV